MHGLGVRRASTAPTSLISSRSADAAEAKNRTTDRCGYPCMGSTCLPAYNFSRLGKCRLLAGLFLRLVCGFRTDLAAFTFAASKPRQQVILSKWAMSRPSPYPGVPGQCQRRPRQVHGGELGMKRYKADAKRCCCAFEASSDLAMEWTDYYHQGYCTTAVRSPSRQ
jgi:hypothetical protein